MTAPAQIRLSPADSAFFAVENDSMPQVTALLTLLECTPDLAKLKQAAMRGVAFLPRMGYVKHPSRLGVLVLDGAVDFDAHVRRIHAPGISNLDRLLETVSELHSAPLPRDRPLWEFLLISNRHPQTGEVPAGENERAAVLWRIHHGLSDGIRSLNVFRAMLAPSKADDPAQQSAPRPAATQCSLWRRVVATMRVIAITGRMSPIPSPLNGVGSSQRMLTPVELDRTSIRAVMRRHGVSSHDAVLTALASALRQFHRLHGASLNSDLRAIVPGNSRPIPQAGVNGNFTDLLWVMLPISEPDPIVRLQKVVAAISQARTEGWIEFSQTFPPLIARMPLEVQRQSFHKASILTNTVCTIMPSAVHRYELDGQSMRNSYAAATLLEGHGAGFTFMTSGDAIRGAIVSDPRIVTDAGVLGSLLQEGVEELATAGRKGIQLAKKQTIA